MATLYKVYVEVLAERLKEEVKKKRIIPENQTGFRKGMGTMDNIYVINYLINRQLGRKEEGMLALFGLRSSFDSVDRGVLLETMGERGIRKGLRRRVGKILRETKNRVIVGEEGVWMARRGKTRVSAETSVIQCVDGGLEGSNKESEIGSGKIDGEKVHTLAYADNGLVGGKVGKDA